MRQYQIQVWGRQQEWFNSSIWELEPPLFAQFLTYLAAGFPMHGTRVIRTSEPAEYRFLGGESYLHLKNDRQVREGRQAFQQLMADNPDLSIIDILELFYNRSV